MRHAINRYWYKDISGCLFTRVKDSFGNIFLKRYFTKFGQKLRTFQMFFEVTLSQQFWNLIYFFLLRYRRVVYLCTYCEFSPPRSRVRPSSPCKFYFSMFISSSHIVRTNCANKTFLCAIIHISIPKNRHSTPVVLCFRVILSHSLQP